MIKKQYYPEMVKKRGRDVFLENLEMDGKQIIDIGCGNGALVRLLTRNGAQVIGVEFSSEQLEQAHKSPPVSEEQYLSASAEELPLADESADTIIFFNSLHHIPIPLMSDALTEALRVLRPEGVLFVGEPLPDGSHHEFTKQLDDETEVLAAAYQVISNAGAFGLEQTKEFYYNSPFRYDSFTAFKDDFVRVDPARLAQLEMYESELYENYNRLGRTIREDQKEFDQFSRVNIFRKKA